MLYINIKAFEQSYEKNFEEIDLKKNSIGFNTKKQRLINNIVVFK